MRTTAGQVVAAALIMSGLLAACASNDVADGAAEPAPTVTGSGLSMAPGDDGCLILLRDGVRAESLCFEPDDFPGPTVLVGTADYVVMAYPTEFEFVGMGGDTDHVALDGIVAADARAVEPEFSFVHGSQRLDCRFDRLPARCEVRTTD